MSEERRERTQYPLIVFGCLLLLVLYALSIGPAAWATDRLSKGEEGPALTVWLIVYSPIIFAANQHAGTQRLLIDYVQWCLMA